MEPSLGNGQLVFVNQLAFRITLPFTSAPLIYWDKPKHGDILLFRSPGTGKLTIKRCIALEGDPLSFSGKTLILNQTDVPLTIQQYRLLKDYFKVPQGHVFVLGDNPDYSLDSRDFGFVPFEDIVGKVIF